MDAETRYVDIPDEILEMYKIYRPSPLCRAYNLEKALGTPAKIYYKFEGNNTSGSHKLNSAIAQAYYAKDQGLTSPYHRDWRRPVGTALSEACSYFGLDLTVLWSRFPMSKSRSAKRLCRPLMPTLSQARAIPPMSAGKFWPMTRIPAAALAALISEAVEKSGQHRRLPLCPRLGAQPGAAAPVHYRAGGQGCNG